MGTVRMTRLSVISGRSEDGTMFWIRGGMWGDLRDATMMPTEVAERLARMKQRKMQRDGNRWLYNLTARPLGLAQRKADSYAMSVM
jgi:hypothetical protein